MMILPGKADLKVRLYEDRGLPSKAGLKTRLYGPQSSWTCLTQH